MSVEGINASQPIAGTTPPSVQSPVPAQPGTVQPGAAAPTGFDPAPADASVIAGGPAPSPAAAPAGPAAWSDAWAKKFASAGMSSQEINQLWYTGAMGADEAQLTQAYTQIKADADAQIKQFAKEHPREYKRLLSVKEIMPGSPDSNRAVLLQIAQQANIQAMSDMQLRQTANDAGKSEVAKSLGMLKMSMPYMLVPAWGAIRVPLGVTNDGYDPFTNEKLIDDKFMTGITGMTAVGGGITAWNHVRGAKQVAEGRKLIAAGGDAGQIAAKVGLGELSGRPAWKSYLPGSFANRAEAGLSRLPELERGIQKLPAGSIERELAENVLAKVKAGDVKLLGEPAQKLGWMGLQPNSRGMFFNRYKPMISTGLHGSTPALMLDGRMTGTSLAAHVAAAGLELADDTPANNMLKSRAITSLKLDGLTPAAGLQPAAAAMDPATMKLAREHVLGSATQKLLKEGYVKPSSLQSVSTWIRPGAMDDALAAAKNVGPGGRLGAAYGTARIPNVLRKTGLVGLVAAGAYYMMFKMPRDQAKKSAAMVAKAQKQAEAKQATQAGAAAQGATSQPMEAALQEFAKLPKQQQMQVLQQQAVVIQQASQQPNLTVQQQQQIAAATAELEMFAQIANSATDAAAAPATVAPAPGIPAGFTAQGMGLA